MVGVQGIPLRAGVARCLTHSAQPFNSQRKASSCLASSLLLVGVQGIEPCLPAPKAGVLPVYDTPLLIEYGIFIQHCKHSTNYDFVVIS